MDGQCHPHAVPCRPSTPSATPPRARRSRPASAEEVAWQLGHRNSIVTRTVYIQEIRNAERSAERRARLGTRYGDLVESVPPA